MSRLWTAAAAAAATGGRVAGDWAVDSVSIDTRSLGGSALFVALRGENRDGHAFVGQALAANAVAMVSRVEPGWPVERLLVVEDTLAGLEALGRAGRQRSTARILGVTGSVGKTGTKEALRHVLSEQAAAHASAASYNNHWGVPLSLARLPQEAAFGVFEMGMNHAGELSALTAMVRPHVALVTWIAPAHLEYFGSEEAIADAKGEIFEGLEPGGAAVLPRDSAHFERLAGHAARHGGRITAFGRHEASQWRLLDARIGAKDSRVRAQTPLGPMSFRVGIGGAHWVTNALAVLAAVHEAGGDVRCAAASLASLRPPPGRGARHIVRLEKGTALLLDESYNANPVSMRAALDLLGRAPGRRLAALGDMLELGEHSAALHAGLADAIALAGVDRVFTCGPMMDYLHRALPGSRRGDHTQDSSTLVPCLRQALRPGDVLLVKGSLGSRMARIVDALTAPPDDQALPGPGPAHAGGER
ncbi:UDP-N-acetylmuramoyl-tripeptide--D-alanyl-D-alanine ligase [Marinimicrococcus flavescens]|uniref:UDP-N-acetylmuramoyl-tripeptide--D-alanyl-D-alanine ligase n=1 Tax=Marinimicrococcus flavescens TaxID=3031815 RepID=A0AAP4D7S8_9PROT|nr:UDP-N-acetylmuramoyl-tripeptide--D-alanyl-D-alanine ligase [Marinimicrococcus flavescens]